MFSIFSFFTSIVDAIHSNYVKKNIGQSTNLLFHDVYLNVMKLNLCVVTLRVYKNHKNTFHVSLPMLTNRELLLLFPSPNITLCHTLLLLQGPTQDFLVKFLSLFKIRQFWQGFIFIDYRFLREKLRKVPARETLLRMYYRQKYVIYKAK